jgi:hypothetical protein
MQLSMKTSLIIVTFGFYRRYLRSWIRIRSSKPNPITGGKLNADQSGSGSAILKIRCLFLRDLFKPDKFYKGLFLPFFSGSYGILENVAPLSGL